MDARDVVVLVGSLRRESFTRKVARALVETAPPKLDLEILEIGHLSFYNQDFDPNPPADWVQFRDRIRVADAVLFATPEYNRSIPGVLKNAIDIASRPAGHNAFDKKPGAVISVSPGAIGGFGANHHLRQCLVFLNVPTMPQPEAYIGGAGKMFDIEGRLTDASTRELLTKFMQAFAQWIETHAGRPAEHLAFAREATARPEARR